MFFVSGACDRHLQNLLLLQHSKIAASLSWHLHKSCICAFVYLNAEVTKAPVPEVSSSSWLDTLCLATHPKIYVLSDNEG
ncbi:hypothetical protein [Microcoleus sp. bin38.metabat.b11b12b14.051]|uniref:hypothetical protein n=1 Tax=Microcoleus sp. bin38.metabat.b11b12b14.051 TaxID=2742709 RepID=UPI0025D5E6AA|nr:hypothetical protein [Microcoleus sp. bin38.metabat.b11b12b14.051]